MIKRILKASAYDSVIDDSVVVEKLAILTCPEEAISTHPRQKMALKLHACPPL